VPTRRTLAKLIRLTPDEFTEIERRARAAGRLPARFIRDCVLTPSTPTASTPRPSHELIHALATIGTDLKTLLRATPDESTRTEVAGILAQLVTILRQLTGGTPT
jgi:hypothetical protein